MSWFATSGLSFKGSVASDFALASGSRDTALTIRLTQVMRAQSF
jgi:hypothetical protein